MSGCCAAIENAYEKASLAFFIENATYPSACENQVFVQPTDTQIKDSICSKAPTTLNEALTAIKKGNVAEEIPSVCQADGTKMKCNKTNIEKTLKDIKELQEEIDGFQCKMNKAMIDKKEKEGLLVACSVQLEQRNRACMINEKDCGKCAMLLAPTPTSSCTVKTVCKKKKSSKYSSKKKKKSSKGKKKRKSRSVASSLSTPSGFTSYDSAYSYPYGEASYF